MLAAACLALNQVGEGSSPSSPTDNLVIDASAHDVTATYCLAMAEMRVQFPLGALFWSQLGDVKLQIFRM